MHNANKTVTIYHKEWDSEKGADVYKGTVIGNVSFFTRISTAVSTDGLTAACEGILRIPKESLTKAGVTDLNLKNGDLVCEGQLKTTGIQPSELDSLCPYVFTIVGITRNLSGQAPHIKVVCK